MKKLFMIVLLVLFPMVVSAASLSWEVSDAGGLADGYKIYYNENSKDVGNVTLYHIDDLNLVHGVEYSIYITAYNAAGESIPSNVVKYTRESNVVSDNPSTYTLTAPASITIIVNP